VKLFVGFSLTGDNLIYLTVFLIHSTSSCAYAFFWYYWTYSFFCWRLLKWFLSTVIFKIVCLFYFTCWSVFLVRYYFLKYFICLLVLLKILILCCSRFLLKWLLNIIFFL